MIILPAIDLHQGQCVRLFRGDYDTAQVVARDALEDRPAVSRSRGPAGSIW